MFEIGRLCVKIAGRDARLKCVIIDILDGKFVLIDGQTRRKRCNINHLDPTTKVLKIKKGASHEDILEALKKEGIEVVERKTKTKEVKVVKKTKTAASTQNATETTQTAEPVEKKPAKKAAKPAAEKKPAKKVAKKE
jgi:large subunit ribosomal protein L14e